MYDFILWKHYAKQFIWPKPIRFCFKNWALCTSSEYMMAFDIRICCLGKDSQYVKHIELGGKVVLNLLLKRDGQTSGYKMFFDNFLLSYI